MVQLIGSTAEAGHPWSCSGGTIELELTDRGALLVVAREGEAAAKRWVASPDDLVPLGEALLATPLTPAPGIDEQPATAVPASPTEIEPQSESRAAPAASKRPATMSAPRSPSVTARSLLLAAGVDGRDVGGSDTAWIGPTLSAALRMGRWLPSISLREQSAIGLDGPSIDELSVAFALQARFELPHFELRAGLALRGAAVDRDLPRPSGDQIRLEARAGAVGALAIPVLSWANVVISIDGDVVVLSRKTTQPEASASADAPTPFPTYTLGGSACFEVSL